jgi:hypothetical protein
MEIPDFRRGEQLTAKKLNQLGNEVRLTRLLSGPGYTLTQTPGGTILNIQQQAGPANASAAAESLPCPFKVTDASEGENMKVMIDWGLIWQMLPTGMYPDNKPPLVMDVSDDCYVYSYMKFNKDSLILEEVKFVIESDFVQNTSEVQYNLIARVLVDTDAKAITSIKNLCIQPFPSPCALTA